MALFPMFVDLTEQTVLIVGDGPEAARKAARMELFSHRVVCTDYASARTQPLPSMVLLTEKGHPENAALAAYFRQRQVPVNTADEPALCDFPFPAVICRGDVTVAVSTGGKSPALAGLLRRKIETALPEDLEETAALAAELTTRLRREIPDPKQRREKLLALLEEML